MIPVCAGVTDDILTAGTRWWAAGMASVGAACQAVARFTRLYGELGAVGGRRAE